MIKKNYLAPKNRIIECKSMHLLNISGSGRGISYGGVDTGGTKEVSARAYDFDEEDSF